MAKLYPLFLILLTIAISGCTFKTDPDPTINQVQTINAALAFPIREPSTVYVEIIGSAFDPSELRVVKGTIVKWENMDSAQHTITGKNFSSPPLSKRETWTYTFNKTGTFEYNCSIHPWMRHGYITVE